MSESFSRENLRHVPQKEGGCPTNLMCRMNGKKTHTHSKKLKGRAESNFMLFLKINDHPTRCFNFGLRGIYPNDWKFDLNLRKNKSKTNTSNPCRT